MLSHLQCSLSAFSWPPISLRKQKQTKEVFLFIFPAESAPVPTHFAFFLLQGSKANPRALRPTLRLRQQILSCQTGTVLLQPSSPQDRQRQCHPHRDNPSGPTCLLLPLDSLPSLLAVLHAPPSVTHASGDSSKATFIKATNNLALAKPNGQV